MICFPLDITEYEAVALGSWCATRTRGVISSDDHYPVTANGDMSVTLGPGIAWVKKDTYWGVNIYSPESTTLNFDTADGALTRYAAVCLRLDKNLNAGVAVIKYGPLGVNPTISSLPMPERDSLDYDEIYVAAVRIRAGATEILTSDIFDLRLNETYCGVVRDGITGIPTQELYDAWRAWFSSLQMSAENRAQEFILWMISFQAQNEQSLADWVSSFKTSNAALVSSWFDAFTTQSEGDFNDWFSRLQSALDDNQAANLFNMIDQHERKNADDPDGVHGLQIIDNALYALHNGNWRFIATLQMGMTASRFDSMNFTASSFDAMGFTADSFDNQ